MTSASLKMTRILVLFFLVLCIGTVGYRTLLGWSWLDSLYFTVITITTVGFGEIRELGDGGRLFTILLMFGSIGIVMYTASSITELMVELQFSTMRRRRRMQGKIDDLSDHYIICGFGRTGSSVYEELTRAKRPVVVVENDAGLIEVLEEMETLVVTGDATGDECLSRAGIERAKGLVAALSEDAQNVYLILSARKLNPDVKIVSWATSAEAEDKILLAGADHVLRPFQIAGVRIAQMLENPHAMEFIDQALSGKNMEIQLGQIEIRGDSPLCNKSLTTMDIHRDMRVIVIGIRRADGRFEFNPSAESVFEEGDMLIGMGSQEQIDQLRTMI